MAEVTEHAPGTFSWTDLATTDPEGAKAFYTGLFGWNATDMPAGEGMTYTMLDKSGKNTAGLYDMGEEMKGHGVPPHWTAYVSVASADESAKKAEELGGKLMMPAFDIMDAGRMAVVEDPSGGKLALWQAKGHIGSQIENEPGAMCWNELATNDIEAAGTFYKGLFGWTDSKMPMSEGAEYTMFHQGEAMTGGMMVTPAEWGDAPPMWMVSFLVENLDDSLNKVKSLGGKQATPSVEIPFGKFSFIQDPQGAYVALFESKEG